MGDVVAVREATGGALLLAFRSSRILVAVTRVSLAVGGRDELEDAAGLRAGGLVVWPVLIYLVCGGAPGVAAWAWLAEHLVLPNFTFFGWIHLVRRYVAVHHADLLVTTELFPLAAAIEEVRRRFVECRRAAAAAAERFPARGPAGLPPASV
jgi:hypothetical protein